MDAELYNEIASVFAQCVDLDSDEREAFIQRVCKDRPEVERGLRGLLDYDRGTHVGDESELRPMIESAFDQTQIQDPIPATLAGHQVIRVIGRGGMGVVYEAQQQHPHRRVAIKVLHGAVTELSRELMLRESSILARMEAPGIARVYEAGMTEVHGRSTPYIVMELIDGVRIDANMRLRGTENENSKIDMQGSLQYGADHDASQVIELLARTADAVQQAHRNGVIHRDLKPANILVVEDDDGIGQPVVLDFGVGRVVDAQPHTFTHSAGIVGTLGYLSPEQISGSDNSIDIRSDVYALGAVAFLLLTGEELYDLDGLSVQAALYRIANESSGHILRRIGQSLVRIESDTALVLAKALHADPDHRYQTATEFAQDLRKLNTKEPISARKPSLAYNARKFVERNRFETISALAGLLVVAIVIVGAFVMVNRERNIAVTKAATTEEIARFLEGIISSASPNEMGKDVTVRESIAQAELLLMDDKAGNGVFDTEPIVEADLRMILGRTHRTLGDQGASLRNYELAHEIYEREYGLEDRRTLYALGRVGVGLRNIERYEEAIDAFKRALSIQARKFGPLDQDTLTTMNSLGILYSNLYRFDEAEEIAEQVLAAHRSSGQRDVPLFSAMHNMALLYRERGVEDPEILNSALKLLLEAEEGYRDLGQLVPRLISKQLRGSVLILQRNLIEAEECLVSGLDESIVELPDDHFLIKLFLIHLGRCLYYAERYEEARVYLERGLLASDEYYPMHGQAKEILMLIDNIE
ncbi:MAG: tetratricopeptide repeat protein [Phycisphaerales bacterium]